MSSMFEHVRLRERIAGKWQIPALFIACVFLLVSIAQIRPPRDRLPFDQGVAELEALLRGGLYASAIEFGDRLLERGQEEKRHWREVGPVHLIIGRAIFLQAQREKRETPDVARRVIAELDVARRSGVPPTPDDHQVLGTVHEWLGQHDAAVEHYEAAIAGLSSPSLELRRRVLRLRAHHVATPSQQLHALLDAFIADAEARLPLLHWAVELKVNLWLDESKSAEARACVEGLRPVFEPTGQREAFEYLLCLIDYRSGRFDDAEAKLRALRNRLRIREEVYALSGWLLGRVVLNDGSAQRPEEALSFFRDVVNAEVSLRHTAASQLGMAEALAELHRWPESLDQYRKVIRALPELEASPMLNADVVRSSVTVAGQRLRAEGQNGLALDFFEAAAALVDPVNVERLSFYLELLGETRANLARSVQAEARSLEESEETALRREALHEEARRLLLSAGDAFVRLARINTLNERLSSAAAWRAADLFDEGGARGRTIALLREFVRERPEDVLAPRAWVRLGQSLHSLGRFEEAIEAYRECYDRFRRTLQASQSLIPLADCYMQLGTDYVDQAETTLRRILEDWQLFTPEAYEFRVALFMLGDLLNREGRYEEAISTLEEALRRYADDERAVRGLYLLADSYRLSALALKEDLKDARLLGERENMRKELQRRLLRASELFGELIGRYEAQDESQLSERNSLYLRHARLYQGDCLFELQQYGEALKIFERAAWIYKDSPSSLAAYVQIINCYVFLGQHEEGKAALRRAQYLVKTLPDTAFESAIVAESRAEWKQYFGWIETSGLLEPPQQAEATP
ncbi:MAG: tetratricopeptide repeat protein [Phycisphaerales bacterium]|nr:MAG: tetratricopeptide repeat protein [Phycisphaerales bacterium]